MRRLLDALEERTGYRGLLSAALDEPVLGGASFAYVFGSVLVFIFVMQAITGLILAMYYSPSSTDAWASVAYLQDQVSAGWFVRGLHHHGASAMVVVAGLHLLQTATWGAYKKPRELNWIVGVLLLGLVLAFALTGYLLPWDQTGYWATKVATGIAGTTPLLGDQLKELAQGGNQYGNLTLTHFYAIHVLVLPGALVALVVVHLALFRRHGQTPHWKPSRAELEVRVQPFWPDQMFKDMVAMAATFIVLVGLVYASGGAGLDAPADPASNFDARPEWYFRPLYQLLKYFHGPMERLVALGTPVVVGAVLLGLPFVDRGEDRSPRVRLKFLAVLLAGFVGAGALTAISMLADRNDPEVQKHLAEADKQAEEARRLARENGVPTAGGTALTAGGAGALWKAKCAGCHQGAQRRGPFIGPGYNSRPWIRGFLEDPNGEDHFGVTGINKMPAAKVEGGDLDALVELVYSQTGAADVDADLAARGKSLFEDGDCSNCHEIDGESDGVGPNLAGRGSLDWLTDYIALPSRAIYFGERNEMPPFYDKLDHRQRHQLAAMIRGWQSQPLAKPAPLEKKAGGAAPDENDGDDGDKADEVDAGLAAPDAGE